MKSVQKAPETLGNTKQESASKRWCFTLNNYTENDYIAIKKNLSANSSNKWIIGKEVGEQGTPHLQGYIAMTKRFRWSELKLSSAIHWEKCKGDEKSNYIYCSKEGKFETNMIYKIPRPLKVLKEEQLYEWQKKIIALIKTEADDRTIHWYWEPNGNIGKTTFCKYLSAVHGAVPIEGKKNDILYCASEFESDIYLFDFERSMEDYISYGAIEKIKNGYYMCSKYESKPIIRNCPHIIIFANFEPEISKLSKDRWNIIRLNNVHQ